MQAYGARQRMRSVARIAAWGLAAYLVAVLLIWIFQRRLLYPAPRPEQPVVAGASLQRTETREGLPVVALYLPAAPGQMTVVHFHGNGDQLADVGHLARLLHERGLGVFAVEYPGYGLAAGAAASEQNIYAVAEAAIVYLRDVLHVPTAQVVLQGHSLGSGVAAEMAARGLGARLILVSPYTSMTDMAARLFPIFPSRYLLRDRYDTLGKAPRLKLPVLIVHGRIDTLIPLAMGQRLAAAIAGASIAIDDEAGHNDVFASGSYPGWAERFARGERVP